MESNTGNQVEHIIKDIKKQGVLDAFGDGVSIQDTHYKILYQNKRAKDIIGDHVGQFCYEVYERKENVCVDCPLALSFRDGKSHTVERTNPSTKKPLIVEITTSPLRDKAGNIIAGIEVVRDITIRKRTEELIKGERDKAQMYLDVAGVMLLALDTEGKVGLINKRGCEILGHREEDIIGKNWFKHFLPFKVQEEVSNVFKKLMSGQAELAKYHENPILTRHGEEKIIAWYNALLKDEKGNITGTLSSGEDVTLRKKIEQELKERIDELELFYNTAIGRELKMKELKTELEQLKTELRKKSQL